MSLTQYIITVQRMVHVIEAVQIVTRSCSCPKLARFFHVFMFFHIDVIDDPPIPEMFFPHLPGEGC